MVKKYFNDLMRDKRKSPVDILMKTQLVMVSWVYGIGIKIWDFLYSSNILKAVKVPIKVISVGNITLGGTGKTPFVLYLAEKLKSNGFKPAIILRGYGDDEWRIYHGHFDDVKIYVEKDRVKAALLAVRDGCNVAILDDAFQHRRIKKDMEILLMDSLNPFGNKKIFPRGILREYPDSIKRAGTVVLTKSDLGDDHVVWLKVILGKYGITSVFESDYKEISLTDISTQDEVPIGIIKGKRALIFSALADSAYFKYMVKKMGANLIKELDYVDHYAYNSKDLEYIQSVAQKLECEYVITTEKDAVKLNKVKYGHFKIYALQIRFEIKKNEKEFIDGIIRCCRG